MNRFFTLFFIITSLSSINAQTLEELKKQKADLEAKAAPILAESAEISAEIAGINAKISTFPGWYRGAFGTLGANFTGRNQWFSAGDLKDSRATTIMGSFNAFANNIETKYFWRNSGSLNLGWQKLKKGNEAVSPKFEPVADVLNITSLFGYNVSPKLAASSLGEYRTSIIRNFNDPGYFDLGVGFTYTPAKNMIFVIHPINYNFVFSKDNANFTSSLGCKIVGDYNTELAKGVNWRSNLTSFISYKNNNPSLHNGTWTNWLGFNIFNGIGVGLEFALRYSEQEIAKTQNYYTLGFSYKL
ncbi:MAG: DUF3078 domain-containing protein [Saprospiraceae bacterium]|nr:DUF3078 domain-containing protein [Saprospiraceae bacterium]